MKRKLISVFLGGLILFIWNAISWMALPFHGDSLKNIPDSALNAQILQEQLPRDGVYHFPGMPGGVNKRSLQEIEEHLATGPRITLMVYKSGSSELFNPNTFLLNLIFNLLSVAILLLLLDRLADKSFKNTLTSLLLIGLLIGLMSYLPQMNWYMFPFSYTLINVFDHIIALGLLSLLFSFYTFKEKTS
ncbi:MAG: DUF1761 family protein [Bacteroidota bacterium]